jgi:mRNA-degrading endonuclease toxin of MazEF toxin-antitoxin module
VTRGDVFRTRERVPERGHKPGCYLVVSRSFIAQNDDVATVVCAPVYSEVLGISTEVVLGHAEGLPKTCAARCDFLMLMFKQKLTHFVGSLEPERIEDLDRALRVALDIRPTAAPML